MRKIYHCDRSGSEVDYNEQKSGVPENNGNTGKHPERDRSSYERSIVQRGDNGGAYEVGDEDERERERGGNIPGQDQIGVDRSCVRTGSDNFD